MRSAVEAAASGDETASFPHARQETIDRRGGTRIVTVYRVALASAGSDVGLCRVHNLSDEGLMLSTALAVKEGQDIAVSFADTITICGKILWLNESRVGIRFSKPINSADLLQVLATKRCDGGIRAPRLETDTIAVSSSDLGTEIVRVLNISQHGMKVTHAGHFQPGLQLNLILENGIGCRAVVRWSKEFTAGLMLLDPIAHSQLGRASAL